MLRVAEERLLKPGREQDFRCHQTVLSRTMSGLRQPVRKAGARAARFSFSCLGVLTRQSGNKHRRRERQCQVRPRGRRAQESRRVRGLPVATPPTLSRSHVKRCRPLISGQSKSGRCLARRSLLATNQRRRSRLRFRQMRSQHYAFAGLLIVGVGPFRRRRRDRAPLGRPEEALARTLRQKRT